MRQREATLADSEAELEAELASQKERVTGLESTLMHLQNDYDALNEVVLENANRLEKMSSMIQQLTARLESVSSNDVAPRKIEDEKPPHY